MNPKLYLRSILGLLASALLCLQLTAQSKQITGTVFDNDGKTPVIGVAVTVKGTTTGVITDIKGAYKINASPGDVLVFTSLGYATQEVAVGTQTVVNATMSTKSEEIEGVVVTALGITREEKSLGYAVTKLDGDALTSSVSGNWVNSLQGKVAGLTLQGAGTGVGGSLRVTLRGDQSLNYGGNEALFVVDGVPIISGSTSNTSGTNYANQDAPVDFGNGAADINPEDVESITVLKGPASAALYGALGANGAIIITTKGGRKTKGVGVTVNSTVSFERAGFWPEFQTEYGSGSDMGLNPYNFWPLTSEQSPDGVARARYISRYAFGEKFDRNVLRNQYASKDWATGTFTDLPWVYQDDWYTGIFRTGVTFLNTITVDGSNGEGTSARLSITDSRNDWILPNTGIDNQSLSLAVDTKINKFMKLNARVNYYRRDSDNMPTSGYDETSVMYGLAWGYNTNSINDWKNEYFNGRFNVTNWSNTDGTNGESLVFPSSGSYNPYRTLYEELNTLDKDRLLGNVNLKIDLYQGLTLNLRTNADVNNEFRTQRKPKLTTDFSDGSYREQTIREYEFNTDFLLRYENNSFVGKRLGFNASFGGNNMTRNYFSHKVFLNKLDIDGVYHLNNYPAGTIPDISDYRSRKVINSFYGFVSLSWDDMYFLDVTGRNDWSSTLDPKYNSYFYPSVSASVLLDKVFKLNQSTTWVNHLKLRMSWANVGNDTGPYQLIDTYGTTDWGGGYRLPGTVLNPHIKPENVESWEVGLEGKFLNNRISFDAAFYNSSTTKQIVNISTDQIVGMTGMKYNAGEIRNRGIELSGQFVPFRNPRGFNWSFDINWSKNWNKLISLDKDWDRAKPLQTSMGTTIGNRTYIYSYVGESMHVIYGRGYQRAPEGSFYTLEDGTKVDCSGMHIVDKDGLPLIDESPNRRIGKVDPDWRAGMNHRFSYKNFSVSMAFTGQWGGNCFSVTNFALSYQGKLKNSLKGRYDGLVHNGVQVVGKDGNGNNVYQKNNTVTSNIQTYYNERIWNRNNTEANTFDTSFLKFKELRIDYKLPDAICQKTGFLQGASIGFFATNLFCWTNFPQYDPETGMVNGNNIFRGIEAMTFPMTRTYGVNIKLMF